MRISLFAFVCYFLVTTTTFGTDKVLLLDSTVYGGINSLESKAAATLGYQVDVVSPTVWAGMTTSDFQKYRAIILGDPGCRTIDSLSPAVANRSAWGQAIDGNIIIIGTDATVHQPGGTTMINNGVRFAVDQAGHTGLYLCLSCYYWFAGSTPVDVLDPDRFGNFTAISAGPCYNNAHIVASHPALADLTDSILSNWGCSVHEGFLTFPQSGPHAMLALAIAEGAGNSFTAPDASVGLPYILAQGQGLTPSTNRIILTPAAASNPTNTSHTVCAKLITNGVIAADVQVNFSIISGPNKGITGSGTTDASGVACFTYFGNGGVGTDTISAEAVDSESQPLVSSRATKTWFDPCGSANFQASVDPVICDTNSIHVLFNEFVDPTTGTDPSNYMLDQGLNVLEVDADPSNPKAVWLVTDGNINSGTIYHLVISGVQNLCGREVVPDPTTLIFKCGVFCPFFRCPSNIVAQCEGPDGAQVHYDIFVDPICTNSTRIFSFPPSDSMFHPGTTTVLVFATDTNSPGSSNICSFTVTVADALPPIIDCPSNIVVSSCTNIPVDYSVTATDNCCLTSLSVMPPSHHTFTPGTTTTVNCQATDCNGNTATCSFTVTVVGDTNSSPTILFCPTNITVCASNGCGVLGNYTNLVIVPDLSATITQNLPPGTTICTNSNIVFTVSGPCGTTNRSVPVTLISCCDPPPKDMALWLTLDETAGATCYNSMGGNDGLRYYGNLTSKQIAKASNVGPTRTPGQYVDNCLCYNGLDSAVVVQIYPQIELFGLDFTLDAWVKWSGADSWTSQVIMATTDDQLGYPEGFNWSLDSSGYEHLAFYAEDFNDPMRFVVFPTGPQVPAGVWTHLAVTFNASSSTLKFFINGAVVSTSSSGSPNTIGFDGDPPLWVGASPASGGPASSGYGGIHDVFNGCLDEVEIFRRALAPDEVAALYKAQTHGKCRPSCSLPLPARICVDSNQITVAATICNESPLDQTFSYSLNTLSASQSGVPGAVDWPTISPGYFSPAVGTVLVPAHSCVDVHVVITKPSTLKVPFWPAPQPVACYQLNIQNVSTPDGEIVSCLGELVPDWNCLDGGIFGGAGSVVRNGGFVVAGGNTNVSFTISNRFNTSLTLNPQILVLDSSMLPETNFVTLNNLGPGIPLTNSVTLAPLATTNIVVNVGFVGAQPWNAFYVVLMLDIGPNGALVPADSVTVRSVNPPTVGPALFMDKTNGQAVVNWDVVNTGWTLETALGLKNPNWTPVTAPALPLPDGSVGVTFSPTNNAQFFRLRQ